MRYIGPALEIPELDCLVFGDLHIGSDESLSSSGKLFPVIGLTELEEVIGDVISKSKSKKLIFLGDFANNFGNLSLIERKKIIDFFIWLKSQGKLILIKGNHDLSIQNTLKSLCLDLNEYYFEKGFLFCHGDKIIDVKESKIIVIAHEHPAIKLTNGIRTEKYKCVIESEYKQKKLIVLPSPNQLTIGTDILTEKLLSPYLTSEVIKKSKIKIVEGLENLDFGSIENLY